MFNKEPCGDLTDRALEFITTASILLQPEAKRRHQWLCAQSLGNRNTEQHLKKWVVWVIVVFSLLPGFKFKTQHRAGQEDRYTSSPSFFFLLTKQVWGTTATNLLPCPKFTAKPAGCRGRGQQLEAWGWGGGGEDGGLGNWGERWPNCANKSPEAVPWVGWQEKQTLHTSNPKASAREETRLWFWWRNHFRGYYHPPNIGTFFHPVIVHCLTYLKRVTFIVFNTSWIHFFRSSDLVLGTNDLFVVQGWFHNALAVMSPIAVRHKTGA